MKALITALLFCLIPTANAAIITGRVVSIADGDTITVLDETHTQFKIRLSGIDAPEIKKQAFGQVSKRALSDLVYDQNVLVIWNKQDRYARYIGKVIKNGKDINLLQVKQGMAWFYRKYQNELSLEDRLLYSSAEDDARSHGYGLWGDSDPIAPWDFRHNK